MGGGGGGGCGCLGRSPKNIVHSWVKNDDTLQYLDVFLKYWSLDFK